MKFAVPIARRFTNPSSNQKPLIFHGSRIKELHAHYIRIFQAIKPYPMSEIIKCYALSQSSLFEAHYAVDEIDRSTLPIWNYMIRGFALSENPSNAFDLFDKMRELGLRGDHLTFIFLCRASGRASNVENGRNIHLHVIKLGFISYPYVCNALIHMYGSCGDLGFSRRVFDEMNVRDLVCWNSMICSYSQCGQYKEVLGLFTVMKAENVIADSITLVKIALACNYLGELDFMDSMVKYIEDNCVQIDVYLGNTLIYVYCRRGLVALAQSVFDKMKEKNIVSWNALLSGIAKSGNLLSAKKLFDQMQERDVISWTCMITEYAKANRYDDVIQLFKDMMVANIKPDKVTLASVFSACGNLGVLDVGNAVHNYTRDHSIKLDIFVENALIDMYCKCGAIEKALEVFCEMKDRDSVSWTSIICGLAKNGRSDHALNLFSQMEKEGKIKPTNGTFIGVLLACVHAGLVDKGLEFFQSMKNVYGLVPEMRHYGCVVDLFCRAGSLHRAYEFIMQMPVRSDAVVWRMLLSGCNVHGDMALGKIALEMLLKLDPNNGGNYALSSNVYASSERWNDALKMRELVHEGGVVKPMGWSLIE